MPLDKTAFLHVSVRHKGRDVRSKRRLYAAPFYTKWSEKAGCSTPLILAETLSLT
jgi:hypothetical protein